MAKTKLSQTHSNIPRLADRPEYRNEVTKLERVKSELDAGVLRLENLRRIKLGEEAERFLQRNMGLWTETSDQGFDRLALEIAAAGEIGERLAGKIRVCAREAPPIRDEYDQAAIEKIRDAERHVELFRRAIALQERSVLKQKKLALADACNSSRDEREKIARKIADCAVALISAVKDEHSFFERLGFCDEALPSMQTLGPFPIALDPGSEVCRWLGGALHLSEVEARNLMLQPAAAREGEFPSSQGIGNK